MKRKISMYPHPGSMNHGCEAIVRSTAKILQDKELTLYSYNVDSDKAFGLDECVNLVQTNELRRITLRNILFHGIQKVTGNRNAYYKYRYKPVLETEADIVLSIGGDNYCYGIPKDLICINKELKKQGKKLVLWGCSIEPDILKDSETLKDIVGYDLIVARESLTYNALIEAGVEHTILCADPAFLLPKKDVNVPNWYTSGDVVGLNISPMVLRYQNDSVGIMDNYCKLIEYILNETNYHIALIPHVTGVMNDDEETIEILYLKYRDTKRVWKIDIARCMDLKGYISKCRFFVGARTHATIAAYSTYVPTLVVGYSIKAKGIAEDIFGSNENYVVSAQDFQTTEDLKLAFIWLQQHEHEIREHLKNFMPGYVDSAYRAKDELEKIG